MRFNINLASLPYQDAARFYRRWLLALVAVTLLTVLLIFGATTAFRDSRQASRELRGARQKLEQLDSWQKADKDILDKPENRDVRDQSELLNDLIRRKAFSWTRAFAELEQLMPARLHVTSMKPEMTADNQLAIRMTVAGDSRDRALELVRRLEQSKSFRQPEVKSEGLIEHQATQPGQQQSPDTVQFEISALYAPMAQPVQAQTPAEKPAAQTQAQNRPQGVK